ncbi:hypothetical protein D3C72_1152400 [compost metagenome]
MKLLMTSLLLVSFSSSAFAIDYFGTKREYQNKDVIRIDNELFMHMSETPRQNSNDPAVQAMSDDQIQNAQEAIDLIRKEIPEMNSKSDLEIMDMLLQTTQE